MNQQEFEDTARRYREEMFRMYANQPMAPQPKPAPTAASASPNNTVPNTMMPMQSAAVPMQPQVPPLPLPTPIVPPPPPPMPPAAPSPMPPGQDLPEEEPPASAPQYYGKIRVMVSTARGARPVPGTTAVISRESDEKTHLHALQITNESGETPLISVPAPPPSENQKNPAYYGYDISVYAPGYYREASMQVPVFPNVISMQSFDLIPLPAGIQDLQLQGELLHYNHMKNYDTGGEAHADR